MNADKNRYMPSKQQLTIVGRNDQYISQVLIMILVTLVFVIALGAIRYIQLPKVIEVALIIFVTIALFIIRKKVSPKTYILELQDDQRFISRKGDTVEGERIKRPMLSVAGTEGGCEIDSIEGPRSKKIKIFIEENEFGDKCISKVIEFHWGVDNMQFIENPLFSGDKDYKIRAIGNDKVARVDITYKPPKVSPSAMANILLVVIAILVATFNQ